MFPVYCAGWRLLHSLPPSMPRLAHALTDCAHVLTRLNTTRLGACVYAWMVCLLSQDETWSVIDADATIEELHADLKARALATIDATKETPIGKLWSDDARGSVRK